MNSSTMWTSPSSTMYSSSFAYSSLARSAFCRCWISGRVHALVQVLDVEELLDAGDALLGDGDRALGLVDLVVLVAVQARDHPVREHLVPLGGEVGGTGDDERRAGLVDQDRIDLVDDGVVVAALGLAAGGRGPCGRAGSRSRTRCSCRGSRRRRRRPASPRGAVGGTRARPRARGTGTPGPSTRRRGWRGTGSP